MSNDIVSTKIYNKRDDFDFEIVNFPFLDGDVPPGADTLFFSTYVGSGPASTVHPPPPPKKKYQ